MKAGCEIDALVAEKVMGWRYKTFPNGACPHVKHWYCGEQYMLLKPFSTDIAAAWQVVEKLAELHVVSVSCMFNKRWRCEAVQAHSQRQNPVNAIADTAPLAICLAALKAVGVEVEE